MITVTYASNEAFNRYHVECLRLRALIQNGTPVDIEGEQAYLRHFVGTGESPDRLVINAEYTVAEHLGIIRMFGVCTPDGIFYDPPTFEAPPYIPSCAGVLPIKYRSTK